METNKARRFGFLILVPALLFFWGCSRNRIAQTLQSYSHKPGFELKIIHTDSLSSGKHDMMKIFKYLNGVKEVYILKFDAAKGDSAVNQKLHDRLERYIASDHFENLLEVDGKSLIGLYLKKDRNGEPEQVIFVKSGGKHSLYIWAPHSEAD